MKRKDIMLAYFLNQIDIKQNELSYIRSRRYAKLDEVDYLELIILLTEIRMLNQIYGDYSAIYKVKEDS